MNNIMNTEIKESKTFSKQNTINLFFGFFFKRWSKWELYKTNEPYTQVTYCSPILGNYEINRDKVLVDVYVKTNKFNGLKKYKRVVKYR